MQPSHFLARDQFQSLIDILMGMGYRCLGPQVRDGAIVYDEFSSVDQLPQGIHDEQAPGSYSLKQSDSPRLFAWANGAQALKPLLFASREVLWRAERDSVGKLRFNEVTPEPAPTAVFGVRSCDLAAMRIQDQVFQEKEYVDSYYQARRKALLTVAVNCSDPAATCFCASTGDGPVAESGYDLALTELEDGFLIHADSEMGNKVLAQLSVQKVSDRQHYEAGQQALHARQQQRQLHTDHLPERLMNNLDHSRWQQVAERCLSCANCTMVCPTCFCHKETEQPELDSASTAHLREWDSCFTQGHSYIHGTTVRQQTAERYRQWLTHKLSTWVQQFGHSGCVGCGRCIAWCPAAIDITEEANVIAGGEKGE